MLTARELDRLNFQIPEFLRIIWASEQAREYWEPKIRSIASSWPAVERLTLIQGMRPGVLQNIRPEELPQVQNWALASNVPMVVIGLDGVTETYGNAAIQYEPGKEFTYRVYFGLEPERFLDAWKSGDDLSIGRMLGFPDCCIKSFILHWQKEGWRDLTIHSFGQPLQRNLMYNNVLLRHIGIRGVFHLPCSVNCEPSVQIGAQIIGIMMHTDGLMKSADWLQQLLVMPMEWNSLHGVAQVITPIFKTIYASDALATKATMKLESEMYPKEGASGNDFPFMKVNQIKLLFKSTDYTDNGFPSRASMERAHNFVLELIPPISGRILDLGCGNGRLLKEIKKKYPVEIFGVDTKDLWFPGFFKGNIYDFEWEGQYDLVLMSVERLFETTSETALDLLQAIHAHSRYLLLSTYNGWKEPELKNLFTVVASNVDRSTGYEARLLERKTNGI